jgi:hypothetical protein
MFDKGVSADNKGLFNSMKSKHTSTIDKGPGIRAVKVAHLHRRLQARVKIVQIYAMPGSKLALDRFPMRYAAAYFTSDRP